MTITAPRPALILLTFLPLVSGCANTLLLHPSHGGPAPQGAEAKHLPFHSGTLEIWIARADPSRKPTAFVLEFCGNATRADQVVTSTTQRWRKQGAEVWAMNYPGFGGSSGPARLADIPPAALAAYDALAEHASGRPIFLAGSSLGTTAALYVAAHRPVDGLVLHNPPPLRDVILNQYGWWNLWIASAIVAQQVPTELDSPMNAARIRAPAVFVLADHDGLVPPRFHRKVVDAFTGPKHVVILKGATHDSSASDEEEDQIEAAIRWLTSSAS
jgi:pimeloyl-ACP methyl ester carboxylesterase